MNYMILKTMSISNRETVAAIIFSLSIIIIKCMSDYLRIYVCKCYRNDKDNDQDYDIIPDKDDIYHITCV